MSDTFSADVKTVTERTQTPPGAIVADDAGRILSWDAGAERLFRARADAARGRLLTEWVDLPAFLLFGDGGTACRVCVARGRRTDGTAFPLELTLSRVAVAGQRVCAVTVRSLEARLSEGVDPAAERDKYRLLFEFSPQPMWVYDLETLRFLTVNQTASLRYGYSRDEFLAMTVADIRPPEDLSALLQNIETGPHPAGDGSVWKHQGKNRRAFWVEVTSHPIEYEGRAARLIVATDITARVEAERELRESKEHLRAVVNNATIVLFAFDADGVYTLAEGQALAVIGRKPGEAVGLSVFERYADQPEIIDETRRALGGEAVQVVRHYGDLAFDIRYTPIRDAAGNVASVIGVATNITDRLQTEQKLREAREELELRVHERTLDLEVVNDYLHREVSEREQIEAALRESEARFRTIAEATPVAVTITRAVDGGYLFANAHFRRVVGVAADAPLAAYVSREFYADPADWERLRRDLSDQQIVRNYEIRLRRLDGTPFWVAGSFQRMELGGEPVIFSAYDDITDRKRSEEALRRAEEDLLRSHNELTQSYDDTIEGWSHALDLRDHETEGHTRRVTEMTLRLARLVGIDDAQLVHTRRGALLHDIGKMGIPDKILLKPGPLTEAEWDVMRRHPQYAHEMLSPIRFLRPALDIPWCHHEKWDGTGYPRGLAGEEIPLCARIFAVADVWDALRSDRPYRRGWPADKVRAHIRDLSRKHFDPRIVEAFLQMDLSEF